MTNDTKSALQSMLDELRNGSSWPTTGSRIDSLFRAVELLLVLELLKLETEKP